MPCSGYGPLRGAVLPGARPGLARIPWAGAVVTVQDTVHASSSRRRWNCHQVGSTNRRSSGRRRLRAACWLWAPPSQVGESTRRPRQAPLRQQRRQRQWHHPHSCSQVWFKRSKGCNRCAVVQPSFQRVQPCGCTAFTVFNRAQLIVTFLHTESRSPTSAVHLPPCSLCS